jgi:5,10-methenyltetrahydromethanopterin hydrogenase
MNGVASKTILPKIFEIAKINRFDAYGIPSEELQKVLTMFGSEIYDLFTGFSR